MGKLNKNNFLIWDGAFNDAPHSEVAVDDEADVVEGSAFIEVEPLLNDTATFGINQETLEVTLQADPLNPAIWDSISGILKIFLPVSALHGDVLLLEYHWFDNQGNESNTAQIAITILDRPTAWRGRASSFYCELDSGENTGNGGYTTLEKYYTDNGVLYSPEETKSNDIGDPDYIAPFPASDACPLPGSSQELQFWNLATGDPEPQIAAAEFNKTGGGSSSMYLGHYPSSPQPRTVNVQPGAYDSIEVVVSNADGKTVTIYPGSGGSGGGSQAVSGSGGVTITFLTVTLDEGATITLS
jgi:hypothetical protein